MPSDILVENVRYRFRSDTALAYARIGEAPTVQVRPQVGVVCAALGQYVCLLGGKGVVERYRVRSW